MNKEKPFCKIDIKSDAKVISRDRELLLTLEKELEKPYAAVSYSFLFIRIVATMIMLVDFRLISVKAIILEFRQNV